MLIIPRLYSCFDHCFISWCSSVFFYHQKAFFLWHCINLKLVDPDQISKPAFLVSLLLKLSTWLSVIFKAFWRFVGGIYQYWAEFGRNNNIFEWMLYLEPTQYIKCYCKALLGGRLWKKPSQLSLYQAQGSCAAPFYLTFAFLLSFGVFYSLLL